MHRFFARAKHRARRCRILGSGVTFKIRRPLFLSPATPFSVFHFVKFLKNYRFENLDATTRCYRQNKLVELQCAAAKALSVRAVPLHLRRKLKHQRLEINSKQGSSATRAAIVSRVLLQLLAKRRAVSTGQKILAENLATLFSVYKSLKYLSKNPSKRI